MLANLLERAGVLVAGCHDGKYVPLRNSKWPENMLEALASSNDSLYTVGDRWFRVYRDAEHMIAVDVTREFSRIADSVNAQSLQFKFFLEKDLRKPKKASR